MKWTCWIAALFLCCGSVTANAGLFDAFGGGHGCHDDGCCPPTCAAPADCCPEPSCCAPGNVGCAPACPQECCPQPTCCAPAATCCNQGGCCPQGCGPVAGPSCCAPAAPACCDTNACCDTGCAPAHHCCQPKKKGCLSRLFDHFKRDRGCHGHNDCCPQPSCCAPTCAAPVGCN